MKIYVKRVLSIQLCVIIMFFVLISCSEDTSIIDDKDTTINSAESIISENPTETTELIYKADVPDVNYDGIDVTFLVSTETLWGYDQLDATEQNGEAVNDAIYIRNRLVEEKLNINIIQHDIPFGSFQTTVTNLVNAGTDEYDVVLPRLGYGIPMSQSGLFLNVNNLPYIDLSRPYWDSTIERDLTITGKLYFLAGDIHMYSYDATWILYFNKDLHTNLGLPNLYDYVLNSNWTFDQFNETLLGVTTDLDGDGVITADDRVGFITMDYSATVMFGAAYEPMYKKTDDETITLNIDTEKFGIVYNKIRKIFNEDSKTINVSNTSKWNITGNRMIGDAVQDMFANGQSLFVAEVVDCISRYKEMDADFGVLPFPKYDETQENYLSTVLADAMVLSIPVTSQKFEMIGIVLESMAAESRNTVLPAYYDITLQRKRARDEESAAMLDIIFNNRIYQLELMFKWANINAAVISELNKDNESIASLHATYADKASAEIEKTINAYRELEY